MVSGLTESFSFGSYVLKLNLFKLKKTSSLISPTLPTSNLLQPPVCSLNKLACFFFFKIAHMRDYTRFVFLYLTYCALYNALEVSPYRHK